MNGSGSLATLDPPSSPSPAPDKPDASIEPAGQAVADAAIVVCKGMTIYRQVGLLDPEIKVEGGTAIAAVALLMLDSTSGDADFIGKARGVARCVLRRRFTDDDDPAAVDAVIDMAVDAVFEIAARVVHDERIYRLAWAN